MLNTQIKEECQQAINVESVNEQWTNGQNANVEKISYIKSFILKLILLYFVFL